MKTARVRGFSRSGCIGLAFVLAACTGGSPPADASTDTGTDVPIAPTDANSDVAPPRDGPIPMQTLPVEVNVFVIDQMVSTSQATGTGFAFHNGITATGNRCLVTTMGACRVSDCRPPGATIDLGAITFANAGRILFQGAQAGTVMLMQAANGLYGEAQHNGAQWADGAMVPISATGGVDIPAFSATLTLPANLTVTRPMSGAAGGAITIDRAMAFPVSWTPVTGSVVALLRQIPANAPNDTHYTSLEATCTFEGTTGSGSIPTTVLGMFQPSATNTSEDFFVLAAQHTSTMAGSISVDLNVHRGSYFVATLQ